MKPLTIEELKALPVGDWVWIINKQFNVLRYYQQSKKCCEAFSVYGECYSTFLYSDYGTKWIAYKNKELAKIKLDDEQIPDDVKIQALEMTCLFKEQYINQLIAEKNAIAQETAKEILDWIRHEPISYKLYKEIAKHYGVEAK